MTEWLPIATAVTLATAILSIGIWIGSVNTDRTNFKEFMREIKDKIDKIFSRLPPVVATGQSPIRLTDLGKAISKELDASAWANRIADTVQDRVKGKEAYDIQHFSFEYVDNDDKYTDKERSMIRRIAYENGVSEEQVRRVLGIELRDKLLAKMSMDTPRDNEHEVL